MSDPETLGAMASLYEAVIRNWSAGRIALGGDAEYSPLDLVDIEADVAWTEINFTGEDLTEMWRLSMVREDGKWKACDAELRE